MRFAIWATALFLFLAAPGADALTIGELVDRIEQGSLYSHVAAYEGARSSGSERAVTRAELDAQFESYGYSSDIDAWGNVVAELPGSTTPERIYLVGAHYDSVGGTPGADDNASGLAGILEIARIFADQQFDSTIRFVAFDNEEIGLLGSTSYAINAREQGEDIGLALIFDMIGYTSPTQLPIIALPGFVISELRLVGDYIGTLSNSAEVIDGLVAAGDTYAPTLPMVTGEVAGDGSCCPVTRRSDHASFWDNGFDAALLTDTAEFRNPNYHAGTDSIDTLDFDFMEQVVRLSAGHLAERAGHVPEPHTALLLAVAAAAAGRRPRRRHSAGI